MRDKYSSIGDYLSLMILNAVGFRGTQQFAVLESTPTHIANGHNIVAAQVFPQSLVDIFIEQQLHG